MWRFYYLLVATRKVGLLVQIIWPASVVLSIFRTVHGLNPDSMCITCNTCHHVQTAHCKHFLNSHEQGFKQPDQDLCVGKNPISEST